MSGISIIAKIPMSLKCISQKVVCFCCLLKHFEASLTNSVDPDQTAPIDLSLHCLRQNLY